MYQYDVCPFCCKVKAFLDYYKVGRRLCRVFLFVGRLHWMCAGAAARRWPPLMLLA